MSNTATVSKSPEASRGASVGARAPNPLSTRSSRVNTANRSGASCAAADAAPRSDHADAIAPRRLGVVPDPPRSARSTETASADAFVGGVPSSRHPNTSSAARSVSSGSSGASCAADHPDAAYAAAIAARAIRRGSTLAAANRPRSRRASGCRAMASTVTVCAGVNLARCASATSPNAVSSYSATTRARGVADAASAADADATRGNAAASRGSSAGHPPVSAPAASVAANISSQLARGRAPVARSAASNAAAAADADAEPAPMEPRVAARAHMPLRGDANNVHASACGSRYPRVRASEMPRRIPRRTRSRGGRVANSANGRRRPASAAASANLDDRSSCDATYGAAASAAARRVRIASHTASSSSSLGVAPRTSHRTHAPFAPDLAPDLARITPGHEGHGAVPPPHTRHWQCSRRASRTTWPQSSPHHEHHPSRRASWSLTSRAVQS